MMDNEMPVTGADRDRVAAALREELAVGRLTRRAYENRLARTYATETWAQLHVLAADLPEDEVFGDPYVRPSRRTVAGGEPVARWTPARGFARFIASIAASTRRHAYQ